MKRNKLFGWVLVLALLVTLGGAVDASTGRSQSAPLLAAGKASNRSAPVSAAVCGPNATIIAASCERQDVQAAIESARDGDTVIVPAGSCTWTSSVLIEKAITLDGGGAYSVNADHEDTGNWPLTITLSGNNGVEIRGSSGDRIRVTGFGFDGSCPGGTTHGGAIYLPAANASNSWRIDNCRFSVSGSAVRSEGNFGLIDHIYSYDPGCSTASQICVADLRNNSTGAWAFTQPVDYGSRNFVYIEDSTFWKSAAIAAEASSATDAQAGGRFVFRHNYVRNAMVVWHGTESGAPERGGYAFEVYDNEFFWTEPTNRYHCAIFQRGGTALVFNNTVTDYQALWKTWVRRSSESWGVFGRCDGTQVHDGNLGGSYPLGYPCLDQVGRGRALGVELSEVQPQEESKCYLWNNTRNNTSAVHHNSPAYVVEGRDYEMSEDDSAKPPDYIPYPYPHPLAREELPLVLQGSPGDGAIYLNWRVNTILPVTSTWQIGYEGPVGDQPPPITGIVSPTRSYTLTGLTNYAWYTVTLGAMLDSAPLLTDTVCVMPTDIAIYLPLVVKAPWGVGNVLGKIWELLGLTP